MGMNAAITGESVVVREQMDRVSHSIATLHIGDEFEAGHSIRGGGENWISVKLMNGQSGYIPATTEYFRYRPAKLDQDEVSVHSSPRFNSSVEAIIRKDNLFEVIGTAMMQDGMWVRVRTDKKVVGFIDGKTRIGTMVHPGDDYKKIVLELANNDIAQGAGMICTGAGIALVIWVIAIFLVANSNYQGTNWDQILVIAAFISSRYMAIGAVPLVYGLYRMLSGFQQRTAVK
jgi:hypothetical protein